MAVDDPYFTAAELGARDGALEAKAVGELEELRVLAEDSIEHAARVAFVPRVHTAVFSGRGVFELYAAHHRVRRIVTALVDGAVLDIAQARVVGDLRLWRPGGWPAGRANLLVTYEHGHDVPPPRIKQAALTLAKVWGLRGPVDARATQIETGDGSTINLATPGILGAQFGIPEVDQAVRAYGEPPVNPFGIG